MDQQRRLLLAGAAALLTHAPAQAAGSGAVVKAAPPGKPGDFNFLEGTWKIHNRRLKSPGEWDEFPGESVCRTIMGGVGSVEDLRIPARNFAGMGLRLLDLENHLWVDHWVNARSGVLSLPGVSGSFLDGVGTFTAEDEEGGKPIQVTGIWDEISKTGCRWRQATSRDGGGTWDETWIMHWTRA
jgi:hypothetical protein